MEKKASSAPLPLIDIEPASRRKMGESLAVANVFFGMIN